MIQGTTGGTSSNFPGASDIAVAARYVVARTVRRVCPARGKPSLRQTGRRRGARGRHSSSIKKKIWICFSSSGPALG